MIKALFLIFQTGAAWERVVKARRSVISVLVLYFLPMMLLVAVADGIGLVKWGEPQADIIRRVHRFTVGQVVVYETAQSLLMLLAVGVCAVLIKILGENFHGHYAYQQTFTLVMYGMSPIFLLRLADVTPTFVPWATWAVGLALSIKVLHQGVWYVMQPAPPNAFALYLMSSLLLAAATGLVRFVTAWYLVGRIPVAEQFISRMAAYLPF
jgi:hypothetical protein